MPKFKVGDRIIGKKHRIGYKIEKELGTIVELGFDNSYTINFDNNVGGWYNEELDIKLGHGLYLEENEIDLIEKKDKPEVSTNDNYIYVKCINNDELENSLTIGRIYEIKNDVWFSSVYVIGDYAYDKERFEIVDNEEVTQVKPTVTEIKPHTIYISNIKIIRSNNATIVILPDGSKGVSKCDTMYDKFDTDRGYYIALNRAIIKSLTKRIKGIVQVIKI